MFIIATLRIVTTLLYRYIKDIYMQLIYVYIIYYMLQELLLEHADLFYHFKSIAPSGTITQDDIKEITDALLDDFRYAIDIFYIYYK